MKQKASKTHTGLRLLCTALCAGLLPNLIQADEYGVTPIINNEATRGLTTISSAEPMGEGRLTFTVSGNWYNQNQAFLTTPNKDANIINALGAGSYGISPYVDVFASIAAFGSSNYTNTSKDGGWGSIKAGLQGTLPYPDNSMMNLGGQIALIGGTSENQIDNNRADGYGYFQTRTNNDILFKLLQSLSFGTESHAIKLHLNEGVAQSLSGSNSSLLLLGAGLQGNLASFAAVGVELNSRTKLNDWAFGTDPLWVTPSVQFRTFYNTNLSTGIDIALSNDRSNNEPRALEPYRIFGSVAFSFDRFGEKRRAEVLQKLRAAETERENAILIKDQDAARVEADSLAKKAQADSVMLEVTTQSLAEEKAKRTDEENMLLSKGLLTLDTVYFDINMSTIKMNSKPYLNLIAKMLTKYPKLQLEVSGHSDNTGSVAVNTELAQARADAVRNYLIECAPELASKLIARGYGESLSKGDNKTVHGREVNRRVEIVVLNKDILTADFPQTDK